MDVVRKRGIQSTTREVRAPAVLDAADLLLEHAY
jgi:hypothetical protein